MPEAAEDDEVEGEEKLWKEEAGAAAAKADCEDEKKNELDPRAGEPNDLVAAGAEGAADVPNTSIRGAKNVSDLGACCCSFSCCCCWGLGWKS